MANSYRITKKLGTRMMSDSVRARHILIQPSAELDSTTAKNRIDSLKEAIDKGADFAQLATDFSADLGSAQNGGDLNWFTQGQMVPQFNDACFDGKIGDRPIVLTQFGYHLIEITDKTTEKEKAVITSVIRAVKPSNATFERVYNKASEFSILNNTLENFVTGGEATSN